MGFKDLKLLLNKEKRVYLILIVWLIFGYTFYQFDSESFLGYIIFKPFIYTSLFYFLCSFFLRDKIKKISLLTFFICIILSLTLFFFEINSPVIQYFVVYYLFNFLWQFAVFYWLIITAIFAMKNCNNKTIKWDNKFKNWSKPFNYLVRCSLFIGGSFIALFFINSVSLIYVGNDEYASSYELAKYNLIYNMQWLVVILFVIAVIFLIFHRVNLWLGIFLLYIVIFATFTMFNAISISRGLSSLKFPFNIIVYFFNLYILLSTVASLLGEQADILTKKLKKIKPETILIWLILSMAMYEFMNVFVGINVIAVLSFSLYFPILAGIFGIYGIITYSKKEKEKEAKELKREPKSEISTINKEKGQILEVPIKPVYCTNCGTANLAKNKFCTNCGVKLH